MEETDAEGKTAFSQEQRRNSRQQKVHRSKKEKDSDLHSREDGELSDSVGEGTGAVTERSRHNSRAFSARRYSRSRSRTSSRREIKDSQRALSSARKNRHRGEQRNPKGQQPKHMGGRQREVQASNPEKHSRSMERKRSPTPVIPPIIRRIIQRNRSRSVEFHGRRSRREQQGSNELHLNYPGGRERRARSRSRSGGKNAPTDDAQRNIRSRSRVRERKYPQHRTHEDTRIPRFHQKEV